MKRAAEIAINVSHTRPDGAETETIFNEGYNRARWWGENIAMG